MPLQALNFLDDAELNVTMYYNTRGIDSSKFQESFKQIRNLLRRYNERTIYKQQLYASLLNLNREMKEYKYNGGSKAEMQIDPVVVLKRIADELIDDYSAFNIFGGQDEWDEKMQILDLLQNDLLEMRELEPHFQNMSLYYKTGYNQLSKAINHCLMVLPQAKTQSVSANTLKTFRTYFEMLFNILTDIFIPIDDQKEQKQKKEQKVQSTVKKTEKEPEQPPSEQPPSEKEVTCDLDIGEIEQRAKESLYDDEGDEENEGNEY